MTKKSRVWAAFLGFVWILWSSSPVFAAESSIGKPCLKTEKGVIPDSFEYTEKEKYTVACDGKTWQVFESNQATPLRKAIGTIDPQAALDVNGGIKIGNDTDACTPKKAGTIRFNEKVFEGCNGKAWMTLQIEKGNTE